jgi:hypothetical protein
MQSPQAQYSTLLTSLLEIFTRVAASLLFQWQHTDLQRRHAHGAWDVDVVASQTTEAVANVLLTSCYAV